MKGLDKGDNYFVKWCILNRGIDGCRVVGKKEKGFLARFY